MDVFKFFDGAFNIRHRLLNRANFIINDAPIFPGRLYFEWLWAAIKLAFLFLKELTLSNISVLRLVIKPKLDIQPRFFAMPTDLKENWEITLLSSLITLTPGTIVVHVSDDQNILYIHAIDAIDVEEEIQSIKDSFEKAIMEVSRSW